MTAPARVCSKCGGPRPAPNQRYCRSCKAEYMRDWRARQRSTLFFMKQALADRGMADILARHFPEAGRSQ